MDIEALREEFLNKNFDEQDFDVDPDDIVNFAVACGEVAPRYTDPSHPDFQAPPTFASSFHAGRRMPEGFPKIPGLGMDGGKAASLIHPIRPGVRLTGRTHLHDIYTKTGRSGPMTFLVMRMEIYDPDGVQVATADTSVVIRERPGK